MTFCKNCGAELEESDTFCADCGANNTTGQKFDQERRENTVSYSQEIVTDKEPIDKLFVELAYSGMLFWLPLVTHSKHEHARYCANQGLWLMIVAAIPCWIIQAFGWVKSAFAGSFFGAILSGVYVPVFISFLFFMFYLTYRAYRGAMAIHHGVKPDSILFFENNPLIK